MVSIFTLDISRTKEEDIPFDLRNYIFVDVDTKEEAIAVAKHRIKDRAVEVDKENTYQVEDEDLIKEIEEDEKRADKEESKASAKPKKIKD